MENTIPTCIGNTETEGGIIKLKGLTNNNSLSDSKIVEMYCQRNETAISETDKKYNAYLMKIARNILGDTQDSEESVNDTYLKTWDSIPPHTPENLATYLGKLIRNLSIDMLRKGSRKKRYGSQFMLSLTELEECVPSIENPHQIVETKLLTAKINEWIDTCSLEMSNVFVGRYYYMDSIKSIAAHYDMSESKVKSILHRSRNGLKIFLEKEGFTI
jgi:RNA polymerase sigma-70 factor (ECF subfamily)